MAKKLKRTNLYEWHVAHGGRMVDFAGWEMPVQYPTAPKQEHHLTRTAAGLFDIDHMGQVTVSGPEAEAYLNHLVTWDVSLMSENEAHYALMCYADGGIVDDVYIYRLPQHWLVVINAGNRAKDLAWMQAQSAGFEVTVTDVSDETYMLALQGPKALHILSPTTDVNLHTLKRFTAAEGQINDVPVLMSRTGYTGEDGVELYFSAEQALTLWTGLLDAGADHGLGPIGLAARDSLRFEPGFALYGHEISADITPIEARLGWAIKFDKAFLGREAILKQKLEKPMRLLVGFEMQDRSVPRQGYEVTYHDEIVGQVVSGLFAPTINKTVGHALVPRPIAKPGTAIQIIIRGKPRSARIVKRPFYQPAYKV